LKESDTEDKKARINQKVTLVTYYNLIDACIALNEFSKAESVLNKLAMESDKKKETNKIDEYKLYLKDIKDRWEINNG
jgi:pentatricopeptide repeat protein